jgi:predicted MPP superfamily phosphohydrolase
MPSFGTLLLAAWTLLALYVVGRAAGVPWVARRVPRRILFPAAGLLWASFALAQGLGHGGGSLTAALEQLGLTALAVLFLLALPLLAVDAVTGFGLFARRAAPRLRGAALVAGGAMAVVAFVQGHRAPVVSAYEVRLPGLPAALDGTTLVALADLHLGSVLGEGWLASRITQVQALRPDAVVLLGDLFEGHGAPPERFQPLLARIDAPLGVWAVTGNHEFHGGRGAVGVPPAPAVAGVRLLRDQWVQVRPGLVLAGVDDLTSRVREGRGAAAVAAALADRPPGATVLLSHSPLEAGRAAAAGAGLMLSGHTHAGQIWPFGLLVKRRYPFFAGRYDVAGMTLIVSRGTGTWGPRMRLWRPGEILKITLRPAAPPGT